MHESIEHNGEIIGVIIYNSFNKEGVHFFTPEEFSQQLGYHRWPKGKHIEPHLHKEVKREIKLTQEFLYVKSGKILLKLFSSKKEPICDKVLSTGDCVLLSSGGHAIDFLEETEIVEIKQGPYIDKNTDKELFEDPRDK